MATPEALPSRSIGIADRIPHSLAQLAGPDQGQVTLPVRLAWSGMRTFDVSDSRERLTLYRNLLDCGQRDDIIRYVNAQLLCQDWPRIRRLTAYRLVAMWEQSLPGLTVG